VAKIRAEQFEEWKSGEEKGLNMGSLAKTDRRTEMDYYAKIDDSAEMDSCSTRAAELAAELMDELMGAPRTKVRRAEETICAEERKDYENWDTTFPEHCLLHAYTNKRWDINPLYVTYGIEHILLHQTSAPIVIATY
jgi:hypothetical protein